mmetsp:Transcript_15097/g.47408  ORF Transcript_15097/g.47408 Transcript_15097/m.47408 type:complete len:226 (+) Transcript_15097:695-1372(+)
MELASQLRDLHDLAPLDGLFADRAHAESPLRRTARLCLRHCLVRHLEGPALHPRPDEHVGGLPLHRKLHGGHDAERCVRPTEAAYGIELCVEDALPVAPGIHSVVHDQVEDNLSRIGVVCAVPEALPEEGEVAVAPRPVPRGGAVRGGVRDDARTADVAHMILGGKLEPDLGRAAHTPHWLQLLDVGDGVVHSRRALLGDYALAWTVRREVVLALVLLPPFPQDL